jgi:hypothetical protein
MRIVTYGIAGAACFLSLLSGSAAQAQSTTLMLNGQPVTLDVSPTSVGGVVMVPIRFMSETLGWKVDWNQGRREARIQRLGGDNKVTILRVGSTRARVNGEPRTMQQAPRVMAGRTLIPLREVARFFDAQVKYNSESRVVFVSTPRGSLEPPIRSGRGATLPPQRGTMTGPSAVLFPDLAKKP